MPRYPGIAAAAARYRAVPVNFDGTNDYLTRGAALTGASASSNVTGSFWFRRTSTGTLQKVFSDEPGFPKFVIRFNTNNTISVFARPAGSSTIILDIVTVATVSDTAWHHLMFAWNGTTPHIYLDGTSSITINTNTNNTIGFATPTNWTVGGNNSGGEKYSGDLADFWLAPGQYLDLSQAGNRAKFYNGGRPVNLGATGSIPTGSAPIVFMSGSTADWHTNKGTGGGFTENGALTDGQSPVELSA